MIRIEGCLIFTWRTKFCRWHESRESWSLWKGSWLHVFCGIGIWLAFEHGKNSHKHKGKYAIVNLAYIVIRKILFLYENGCMFLFFKHSPKFRVMKFKSSTHETCQVVKREDNHIPSCMFDNKDKIAHSCVDPLLHMKISTNVCNKIIILDLHVCQKS